MIYCPKCGKGETTTGTKSKVANLCSNAKCKRCLLTNASKLWHCSCDVPWPKCIRHRKPAAKQRVVPTHKRRQQALVRKYGTDKPPPGRKQAGKEAPNRRPPRQTDGTDETDGIDVSTTHPTEPTIFSRKRFQEDLGMDSPVARAKDDISGRSPRQ